MPDYELISGRKAFDQLIALLEEKTLVKVAIPDHDYEQLTVITDFRDESDGPLFQIDPPKGIHQALRERSTSVLLFEFSNDHRLPHRFEANIKEISHEIWLNAPDVIQRYQLRNNFRLKAPSNVFAVCLIQDNQAKMIVGNISLGGLYCHCPNTFKAAVSLNLKIDNLDLLFSFGGERQVVSIKRAVVRRIEGRTQPKHFGIAFEFLHMKTEAKKRLTQIIYDLQRDFLKSRLKDK